jgi:membrane fusion protein (multidrug efflux system)
MTTTDALPQPEQQSHRRKMAITLLSIIFISALLLWLLYWLIWGRFEEYTDDAYVNGNIVQLMSQVHGTVIEINADDTQLVTQGDLVIKLDPADAQIALEQAEASLAETVRQVRQYFENAEKAEASLLITNADLMKAQLDLKRRDGLVSVRAISREEMQHYTTVEKTANAKYQFALHNMRAALAMVEDTHVYTHPLVERQKAMLKQAFLNRQRTQIVAPVTGYVAKRNA